MKPVKLNFFAIISLFFFLFCTPTNSLADIIEYDGLNYSISDLYSAEATCIGLADNSTDEGSLIIPEYIEYQGKRYAVTTIGAYAFLRCTGFTGSLSIPNSVTRIEGAAFRECSGFTGELIIPESVNYIGHHAFSWCSGFTGSLIIPDSVTIIENGTFDACWGFTGFLTLPNFLMVIEDNAFRGCRFTGSLCIPNSVSSIGDNAFMECRFTGSLCIPNSVSSIGKSAFCGCSFNGSLSLPESLTHIAESAFSYCANFSGTLTIPNTVTKIEASAFSGCRGFTGELIIPESVNYIGNAAFIGCRGFTGILSIPISVTHIGASAFKGCSGFTGTLSIPNSLTYLSTEVFSGCSGITNVEIPNTIIEIGGYAFYECNGLTTIEIPSSIVSINHNAFANCMSLSDINVESENPNYSSYEGILYNKDRTVLLQCPGAKINVIFPNSIVTIEGYSFEGCEGLTYISIPNSVKSIGNLAFFKCTNLSFVDIPSSLTNIGIGVFQACSSLISINVHPENPNYSSYEGFLYNKDRTVLLQCPGAKVNVWIPGTVTEIGERAFYDLVNLENIVIPPSVKLMRRDSLDFCENLKSIQCEAPIPPLNENLFWAIKVYNCSLFVPEESVDLYASTEPWSLFSPILPIVNESKEIIMNFEVAELKIGESIQLIATILPEDTADKTVSWTSSNKEIASVSEKGIVTAISVGSAIITATCGEVSAECIITVLEDAGIESILDNPECKISIYSLQGNLIKKDCKAEDLKTLANGIYIIVSGKNRYKIFI